METLLMTAACMALAVSAMVVGVATMSVLTTIAENCAAFCRKTYRRLAGKRPAKAP
ncbi:hypothetical protein GCM10011587_04170 [Pyruvatibacter mobilis]|nr:hypothetical protein GCM10011587_04170 [Pyruvatibacter mobilis]